MPDHPRVCGEKGPVGCKKTCGEGSPPRVRGKVVRGMQQALRYRITPACAGKRSQNTTNEETFGDHPRVCGEKQYRIDSRCSHVGSPPRVRGKGKNQPVRLLDGGITPACAGKSKKRHLGGWKKGDHPRVCGEKA